FLPHEHAPSGGYSVAADLGRHNSRVSESRMNLTCREASEWNAYVSALAIDPQTPATLYAGTNVGGVFVFNGATDLAANAWGLDPISARRSLCYGSKAMALSYSRLVVLVFARFCCARASFGQQS